MVADLRLSFQPNRSLDKKFYKTQFKYLARVVGDGEHIRYAPEEEVPVIPQGVKAMVPLAKFATDQVRLPSRDSRSPKILIRKRVSLDSRTTEHSVLVEIASAKRYAHEHIVSIHGSYLQGDSVFVLFTGAVGTNLKSFLSDVPKNFEMLSKKQRREILLQWTHCLANAMAWLHSYGRPHGNVRPSNITVDDNFKICLGSLEGWGNLTVGPKADEGQLESYQYAAPERWRRAVTVQTSGPSKLVGPGGGRTSRRVATSKSSASEPNSRPPSRSLEVRLDPNNPNIGFSFMPTAKNNFSRLQLGRSDDASVISMRTDGLSDSHNTYAGSLRTVRGPSSSRRDTRSNTPTSQPSQGSSSSGARTNRAARAAQGNSLFVAGPEVRTTVIQTWQSAQYDLFAADVFSLGAVIMSILTLLCKRTAGSFERHRSAKNRTAGRGGGLADASFHANIGQILLWADILHEDAKKRVKKDDGQVFKAVGPILQVVRRCLEREPDERITAKSLERSLEDQILSFSGITTLHCRRELGDDRSSTRQEQTPTPRPTQTPATSSDIDDIEVHSLQSTREDTNFQFSREDQWSKFRSNGLTTSTIPTPGPESSLSSLGSFNFDYERSDTAVEDERQSHSTKSASSRHQPSRTRSKPYPHDPKVWDNYHVNDSLVDPSLTLTPSSRQTSSNHSSLSSEDMIDGANESSFFLSDSRPTSVAPPPTKALPAIPSLRHGDPQTTPRRKSSRRDKPSKKETGRQPIYDDMDAVELDELSDMYNFPPTPHGERTSVVAQQQQQRPQANSRAQLTYRPRPP